MQRTCDEDDSGCEQRRKSVWWRMLCEKQIMERINQVVAMSSRARKIRESRH